MATATVRLSRSLVRNAIVVALVAGATLSGRAQQLIPGPNINMVRGTKEFVGDPFLQRQNEPSIAVSTRNPCTLFAGTNDYRTVDIPDPVPLPGEDTLVAAPPAKDAWLGWMKSFDCGATWRTGLLPGYPQDRSPEADASGLQGYGAGADPILRSGTNGMFFFGGMVFNRNDKGHSKIFVARWIDDNNSERVDDVRYLGTATIDVGGGGQFLDKPWMAVDIPRNGFGPKAAPWVVSETLEHFNAGEAPSPSGVNYCEIPAANGIPAQRFPSGNAYMAWARFTGDSATSSPAKLMVARSTDCGKTWATHPISNNQQTSQGATIAIAPHDGTVYIAWREFDSKKGVHAIWLTRSTDGGGSWEKPRAVATGIKPFDQQKNETTFRTNALPTIAADHQGRVYVAWAERGFAKLNPDLVTGDARIVIAVSKNGGATFEPRYAVADRPYAGAHQVMPALTFTAGKLQLLHYDFWDDRGLAATKFVDDASAPLVDPNDPTKGRRRHTVDVAAAQADPGDRPAFKDFSVTPEGTDPKPVPKVSTYGIDPLTGQPRTSPPNLPLYNLGSTPFIGDYIDVSGLMAIPVRQNGADVWQPNLGAMSFTGGSVQATSANELSSFPLLPVFHAVWTDHRDVQAPPPGFSWKDYVSPGLGGATCDARFSGMRNANIYTSRLTTGLYVGSPGNSKPLGKTTIKGVEQHVQRAFVVFLQNTTLEEKKFLVKIANQPGTEFGDRASFLQHPRPPFATGTALAPPQIWRIVTVPPISTVARSVYVSATDPKAQVRITVGEVDKLTIRKAGVPAVPVLEGLAGEQEPVLLAGGLRTSVLLNPDSTNPPTLDPDFDGPVPQILGEEEHAPGIFAPKVTTIANVRTTHLEILNPAALDEGNKAEETPDEANPDEANPDEANPDEANAALRNVALGDTVANTSITDVQWKVANEGNTASAFKFRPTFKRDVSKNQRFQLFVTTRYYTPKIDPIKCLVVQHKNQVLVNVSNYNPRQPDEANPDEANPDEANPDEANRDEGNPDEANPDEANTTFMLSPKMTATVTLRIFSEGDAPPPADEIKRIEENTPAILAPISIDTGEVAIQPAFSGPELTVLDTRGVQTPATPRLSTTSIAPAGTVRVFWTLKNEGTSATTVKPLANRFYLSGDRTLARRADGSVDTSQEIELLPTGATGTSGTSFDAFLEADDKNTPATEGELAFVHELTIPRNDPRNPASPLAPGAYFIFIYTDADRVQVEASDGNNTADLALAVAFNLTFGVQPSLTTQDFTMTPAPAVLVLDGLGAPVSPVEVPQVTLTLSGGTATLGGTLTRPNTGGVATFNDLRVDNVGSNYRLNASAFGSFPAISDPFAIEGDSPPVSVGESYQTNEDQALATHSANEGYPLGTLDNDTEDEIRTGPGLPPAGRQLTAVLVNGPTHAASFVFQEDGNFQYQPSANYNGPDSFAYKVNDGRSDGNTVIVSITVSSVNDAPTVAQAIGPVQVDEDAPDTYIDLSPTFADVDIATNADVLSLSVPANDNPSLVTATLHPGTRLLTLDYLANQNGTAAITVRATDLAGAYVDRSIAVAVAAVNDPPVAIDDSVTIFEDQGLGIDVLANDTSVDTDASLRVLSATQPVNGFALLCFPVMPGLTAWWSGDGDASDSLASNQGTPSSGVTFSTGKVGNAFNFNGVDGLVTTPLTVSYAGGATFDAWIKTTAATGTVVTDAGGEAASFGMGLFIEAGGVITLSGSKGTPDQLNFKIIGPAINDGAYHHVAATWTGTTAPNGVKLYVDGELVGSATALSAIGTGSMPINIGGHSAYPAHPKFSGQIDEVHVYNHELNKEDATEAYVVGVAGYCKTAAEGSATGTVAGTWTGTVSTSPNNVDRTIVTLTQGAGSLTGISFDGGTTIAGTLTSQVGTEPQTYSVTVEESNGAGACSTLHSSGSFTIDTLNNTLTGSVTGSDTGCNLGVIQSPALRRTSGLGTGVIYFGRDDNFNGTDSFTYIVDDGNGGTATATVNVTVSPVNDAPTFSLLNGNGFVSRLEDAGPVTVTGFLSNLKAGPTSDELGQTVTLAVTHTAPAGFFTTPPAIDNSGKLTFETAPNKNASDIGGSVNVTITAKDNGGTLGGGNDTNVRTFQISITPVNDQPSFSKGPDVTVLEDSGFKGIDGWATNINRGAPNETNTQGFNFIITNSNPSLFGGTVQLQQSGRLTFSTAQNMYGTATITVVMKDQGGTQNGGVDTSAAQSFVITVSPVNDQPNFQGGSGQNVLSNAGPQTVANWATNIFLGPTFGNAANNETNGSCIPLVAADCQQTGTFIVTNTNSTTHLFTVQPSISPNGTLTYTPAPGASGNANFNVVLRDSGDGTAPNSNTSQTRNLSIFVQQPLSILTTSPMPSATLGQNYFGGLNFANGAGPVTWAVLPDVSVLPPGLSLSGNQISGTPTQTGNYAFTIRATDSSTPTAQVVSKATSISVSAIDQQNGGDGAINALPIDSTRRVSQVVTAGATGPLTTVTFPTLSCPAGATITITIQGVSPITGMPDDANPLADPWIATIPSFNGPIALPTPVSLTVDQRYAVILSSPSSPCSVTNSSVSDSYPGGGAFTSSSPWTTTAGIADLQFRTQMQNPGLIPMLGHHGQSRAIGISGGRVLIIGADGTAEVFDPATRASIATGPMRQKRQDAAVVALSNGTVLVTGGGNFPPCPSGPPCPAGIYLNSSEVYDPIANQWTDGGVMSSTRAFHSATVLADNRVLVAGGSPSPNSGVFVPPTSSTDIFSADGSSATPGPNMVQARQGHQATLLSPTPQVLVTGGYSDGAFNPKSAEILDPTAPTPVFVATGEMNAPRANHTATLLDDGTVLVAGGLSTNGPQAVVATYEIFTPGSNPAAGTFVADTRKMIQPRWFHTATKVGSTVLLTGGLRNANFINNQAPWAAAELYVPGTGVGSGPRGMPSMLVTRYHHGAVELANKSIVIAGGWSPSWQSAQSIELYDPSGPAIANPQLPDGFTTTPYPTTTLTGSGGTGPYSFAVISGAVPPGIAFANGAFTDSGAPKAPGTFLFVVRVTDSTTPIARVGYQTLRMRFDPLDITTTFLQNAFVGYPYSAALTSTPGGGGPLKWKLTAGALPTGLSLSDGGEIRGTSNSQSSNSFTVELSDGIGQTTSRSFGLQVNTASPPFAGNDGYFTNEDTALSIAAAQGVLRNDNSYAVPQSGLTAVLFNTTANGVLTFNTDGSFTYSPNANFSGTDSFTYRASDGVQSSNVATVNIYVQPSNDSPIASGQSVATNEDTAKAITLTATDVDSPTLNYSIVNGPSHGSLSGSGANVTYTPNANYFGSDAFTFTANDGQANSHNALVSISITSINDAPVAAPDSLIAIEDSVLRFPSKNLLRNDSDIESDVLRVTSVAATSNTNGVVALTLGSFGFTQANYPAGAIATSVAPLDFDGDGHTDLAVVNQGSSSLSILRGSANGSFSAGPTPTAGAVPLFVRSADFNQDGYPDLAVANRDSSNVSILLGNGSGGFFPANNVAVASAAIALAVGDVNGDGHADIAVALPNTSQIAILRGYGDGTFQPATSSSVGVNPYSLAFGDFNGDGKLDLATADPGYYTTSVLFGDGTGGFGGLTSYTVGHTPRSVAAVDVDGDTFLDLVVVNENSNTVSLLRGSGTGTFAAATNFGVGNRPYGLAVGDLNGDGKPDLAVSNYNSNWVSVLLGNGAGSFSLGVNAPTGQMPQGVVIADFNGDGAPDLATANRISSNVSVLLNSSADSVTYTPAANFNGAATFNYTVCDNGLSNSAADPRCASSVVTVTVQAVNDAPVAAAQNVTTNEETSKVVTLTAADIDSASLNYIITTGPAHGSLSGTPPNVTYTPAADYHGSDAFRFKANDGGVDSNIATVSITVNPVNDPPTGGNDTKATAEDTALVILASELVGNDSAGPANEPQGLTLTSVESVDARGQVSLNVATQTITYQPAPDYYGAASFRYTVFDQGTGAADDLSAVATVSLMVTEVNDAPVANADSKQGPRNAPLVFPASDLTSNDTRGPANESGQTLTVTSVSAAVNGTVTLTDGIVTFTPPDGFSSEATFSYTVCDNGTTNGVAESKCASAVVTVKPFGRYALVVSSNSSTVIDLVTYTATTTLPVSGYGASVTPNGDLGIVSTFANGALRLIDLSVNPAVWVGTITVPAIPLPESTAITPDGRYAVVSDGGSETDVASVDLQTGTVVSSVPGLPGNQGVAMTPDGTQVLVIGADSNRIAVLHLSSTGVLQDTGQRVTLAGSAGGPRTVAVSRSGRMAFVTDLSGLVSILKLTGTTWALAGSIGNLGSSTSGVTITPDGSKVYVSSFASKTVAVLSVGADDVVTDTGTRISVPAGTPNTPYGVPGIAVTPDGTRLLIASYNSNQISIVDTATDTLLSQTIAVGVGPAGIGMPR